MARLKPPAPPDSVATALAASAPDTVAALHRLFAAKRQARTFIIAGTATAILTDASVLASQSPSSLFSQADRVKTAGLGVGLLGVPAVAIELLSYDGFSRRSEE